MKKNYYLITILLVSCTNLVLSQTMWTGPTITFTKANFADWTLPANQDFITSNVILTRANTKGIFNIATETGFDDVNYDSPVDTEWANGSISDGISNLTFDSWDESNMSDPPGNIGVNKVLHLITDDIYIDIVFTAWSQSNAGGGFTYERSTDQNLNNNSYQFDNLVKLYPNPSTTFIQLEGLDNSV